jgi:hydroxymethylglutaryl-CoA lyase
MSYLPLLAPAANKAVLAPRSVRNPQARITLPRKMSEPFQIVEVGARDGLQSEADVMPTQTKLELIRRLVDAGVQRLEVASFVNPKRVPQMADAEAVMAGLQQRAGVQYIGLVLNRRGFERARAAGCTEIGMVAVATDSFGQRNQGASVEESVRAWEEIAPLAQAAGIRAQVTISVAFGCPFEGEVPAERVVAIAERLARTQPLEIAIADTIGVAVPTQVIDLIARLRTAIPAIPLRCHFHNTRNTAVANVYAAATAGVRTFDASVGGLGGCPFAPNATGNVATEDVLYMMSRTGFDAGIDLEAMIETAHWLQEQRGKPVPGMVSRAGAFPKKSI